MDAGKYNKSFIWQKRIFCKDTNNGQEMEIFKDNETLWGILSKQTIRLRQFPEVSILDKFLDKSFQDIYVITRFYKDEQKNETVCSIKLFDKGRT